MKNIRDIMKIVGCDEARAFRIFNKMCATGIDFSECTKSEFRRAVKAAAENVH